MLLVQIQWKAMHRELAIDSASATTSATTSVTLEAVHPAVAVNVNANANGFSACLVLEKEEDYPYLTEWIAYHWHVLPLRRLIVWNDPSLSIQSTTTTLLAAILAPWSEKIDITVWDHPVQIYPTGYGGQHKKNKLPLPPQPQEDLQQQDLHTRIQNRNQLQNIFLGKCLRTLQRQGQSWTILGRVDEYTLINSRIRNAAANKKNSTDSMNLMMIPPIPDQTEPGSVLTLLQRIHNTATVVVSSSSSSSSSKAMLESLYSQPCLPVTSKQFGTWQDDNHHHEHKDTFQNNTSSTTLLSSMFDNNNNTNSNHNSKNNNTQSHSISSQDFLTLTWHYWGHPEHSTKTRKIRTHLLDLTRIPSSLLHWKVDAHWPVPHDSVCRRRSQGSNNNNNSNNNLHERDNWFVSHHYSGTIEQLAYGEHVTTSTTTTTTARLALNRETRLHKDTIHNTYWEGNVIPQWLDGFVANVGQEQAKQLLHFVGHHANH
jgi:hypothetical protein